MAFISPKQQQMLERDQAILNAARALVLEQGYYGITMDSIAKASGCPKGTLYHRFASKEDILVALAAESLQRRNAMMERGAAFEGRTRERFLAMAEGISLYSRLHPEESQIVHNTLGPVREKASPIRLDVLLEAEREALRIARDILRAAVSAGDLEPEHDESIEEIALGSWGLLEGGFTLIESGMAHLALRIDNPLHKVWRYFNRAVDAYGWQPLFKDWDYEKGLATIRQEIFPKEAEQLYGEGNWYGDRF